MNLTPEKQELMDEPRRYPRRWVLTESGRERCGDMRCYQLASRNAASMTGVDSDGRFVSDICTETFLGFVLNGHAVEVFDHHKYLWLRKRRCDTMRVRVKPNGMVDYLYDDDEGDRIDFITYDKFKEYGYRDQWRPWFLSETDEFNPPDESCHPEYLAFHKPDDLTLRLSGQVDYLDCRNGDSTVCVMLDGSRKSVREALNASEEWVADMVREGNLLRYVPKKEPKPQVMLGVRRFACDDWAETKFIDIDTFSGRGWYVGKSGVIKEFGYSGDEANQWSIDEAEKHCLNRNWREVPFVPEPDHPATRIRRWVTTDQYGLDDLLAIEVDDKLQQEYRIYSTGERIREGKWLSYTSSHYEKGDPIIKEVPVLTPAGRPAPQPVRRETTLREAIKRSLLRRS